MDDDLVGQEPERPPRRSCAISEARLEVHGICKVLQQTTVLRDASLVAEPGRITGLLGPNGAGKSTLFRIIVGLVDADAGTVKLGARVLSGLPMHARARLGIGYLPQEAASFPELSVAANLMAVVELQERNRAVRSSRVAELLDRVGLAAVAARSYGVLSGGERRRLEIAKALALRPAMLLLDEPFTGLDPRVVEELCSLLRGMVQAGCGILLTDHNVHMAMALVDHAYLIAAGTILAEGTPAELVHLPDARRAFFGYGFRL
jgi:lipopolysaccharide export system ATP-binding protein